MSEPDFDEEKCSVCQEEPVYIGTMCEGCWRKAQEKGKERK